MQRVPLWPDPEIAPKRPCAVIEMDMNPGSDSVLLAKRFMPINRPRLVSSRTVSSQEPSFDSLCLLPSEQDPQDDVTPSADRSLRKLSREETLDFTCSRDIMWKCGDEHRPGEEVSLECRL